MRTIVKFLFLILGVGSPNPTYRYCSEKLRRILISQDDFSNQHEDFAENIPYVAQLQNSQGLVGCLATILSEDWLITAAHCVHERNLKSIQVVTGGTDRGFHGQTSSIEKVVFHEYDPCARENDVALIKLDQSININERQMPLQISNVPPAINDRMKVTKLDPSRLRPCPSETPQHQNGPIFAELKTEEDIIKQLPKCQKDIGNRRCGFKESHSSCLIMGQTSDSATLQHGDSGGPAVINDRLVGVTRSRRYNKNRTKFTNIFVNVYEYRYWIRETTDTSCSNSIALGCSVMK